MRRTPRKSAESPRRSKAHGRPFTGHGDPRNGRGPQRGSPNAGRPTTAFAAECGGLQRGEILDRCRVVLTAPGRGPGDPAWQWAAEWVSRYGEREVMKQVDLTVDGHIPLRERVAQVKALLARESA